MKLSNKGITLIELLVAAGLGGIVWLMLGSFLTLTTRSDQRTNEKNEAHLETLSALQTIKRYGRSATVCRKVADTLECDGNYHDSTLEYVRFIQETEDGRPVLRFQVKDSAVPWDATHTRQTYQGIAVLEICTDMEVSAGTCPMPNPLPRNPDPGSDRFFRIRLVGELDRDEGHPSVEYRSAFFTRNAVPLGPGVAMGAEHTEHDP